jgi:hypothetical protein
MNTRERTLGFVAAGALFLVGLSCYANLAPSEPTLESTPRVASAAPTAVRDTTPWSPELGGLDAPAPLPTARERGVDASKPVERGEIAGRVVDTKSKPIAQAWVILHEQSMTRRSALERADGGSGLAVQTDAQGAFRFDQVPASSYVLRASASGHVPDELAGVSPGSTELVLELKRGGVELHGRVSDVLGAPVPGALVKVRAVGTAARLAYTQAPAVTRTDSSGAYSMNLGPGAYELEASHADYASQTGGMIRIESAPATRDFVLVPGGSLRGKVQDAQTGEPVASALVYVRQASEPAVQGFDVAARTDSRGEFVVRPVSAGVLKVYATHGSSTTQKPEIVRLRPGESADGVVLLVDSAGEVRGRVTSEGEGLDGEAIEGAVVTALAVDGQRVYVADEPSDENGEFVISGVLPGSFLIQAIAQGFQPELAAKPLNVLADEVAQLDIAMKRGVTLRGRVEPAGRARVQVEMALAGQDFAAIRAAQANAAATAETDEDGTFVLTGLAPASVKLVATSEENLAGEQSLRIDERDIDGVVVKLRERSPLVGQVRDDVGAPVSGRVTVRRVDDQLALLRASAMIGLGGLSLDERGGFSIPGLRPGMYMVSVSDLEGLPLALQRSGDGAAPANTIRVELPEQGSAQPLRLVAQTQRGTLEGVVTRPDGSPAGGVLISARLVQSSETSLVSIPPRRALSEENGRFVLGDVSDGRTYTILAEDLERTLRKELPGVRVRTRTPLRIVLEQTAGLRVQVRSLARGEECTLHLLGPIRRMTPCTSDAPTLFTDLPPGRYAVTAETAQGIGQGEVQIASRPENLTLDVQGWARVRGRLVSRTSGLPLVDTPLVLRTPGRSNQFGVVNVLLGNAPKTDAEGAFDIGRVPPGPIELVALRPGRKSNDPLPVLRFEAAPAGLADVGNIALDDPIAEAPPLAGLD